METAEPSNFTPRAQQVLALAREEADRLNHNFVGSEHLLLGIVKLGQGTAVKALVKLGLNLEVARQEVEKQVGVGPDQKYTGKLPYTPRVKKIIALADEERKAMGHTYIGTEHLLLGLLREGDGVAAKVMKNSGILVEEFRRGILRELDPNYSPGPGSGGAKTSASEKAAESTRIEVEDAMHGWWSRLPKPDPVDLSRRYDVYCIQHGEARVYRNVLMKSVKDLLASGKYDYGSSSYIELEQADGKSVFLPKHSVYKFCDPGAAAEGEKVPPSGS